MEIKVAAGVIIYDPVKQVILAEHPTGRRWYKKDSKEPETGVMSIPKGVIEEGEDPVEAAIREIKEETDIDLDIKRLHYLKRYDYIKHKRLELFFYPLKDGEVKLENCKCNSFFEKNGKKLPEVNGFCFLNIFTEEKKYLFLSQQKIIDQVIKDYPHFFE